jgi:hypothetical protein
MKKLVSFAVAAFCALNSVMAVSAADNGYLSAYSEVVSEYAAVSRVSNLSNLDYDSYPNVNYEIALSAYKPLDLYYALKDINNDGTPELFISNKHEVDYNIYGFFTIYNGDLTDVCPGVGYRYCINVLDTNEIYGIGTGGAEYNYFTTYKLDGGELSTTDEISIEEDVAQHNGTVISDSDCDELLKNNSRHIIELDWKKLDDFSDNVNGNQLNVADSNEDKQNEVGVYVNGEKLSLSQPAITVDGRTLVPMRDVFEALGADVDWDSENKEATGTKGSVVVKLAVGSNFIYVNGKEIQLDVPAQITGGRTMLPLRAVAESFGAQVEWDAVNRRVDIKL